MTENEAYLQALSEVREGTPNKETWLKAFAHSNGDKESTTAKYLLFRGEELLTEYRLGKIKAAGHGVGKATEAALRKSGTGLKVAFKIFLLGIVASLAVSMLAAILGGIEERSYGTLYGIGGLAVVALLLGYLTKKLFSL